MRIAYLAPYKGPTVLEQRPIVKGLSLSNTVKIELVAKLMRAAGHEVEIVSLGEVVEPRLRVYPGRHENRLFDPSIPVFYSSSMPIRFLNGFWSSMWMLDHLKAQHRAKPFDLVIIFNLKRPHIACANYAIRRWGIPVVFEYEDDSFVNVVGTQVHGAIEAWHRRSYKQVIDRVAGGIAVSPHLLSQLPPHIPKLLLRGVVGDDIASASAQASAKQNWVVFSGTHVPSNGVDRLIQSWGDALPDWELHITGQGQLTERLKEMAAGKRNIVFHGLVSRQELVRLLSSARICINPHAISGTPGNVFAFKIIEYLAAGAHCVTTPMGPLEPALEAGITYMPDNAPATIDATLRRVVAERRFEQVASEATLKQYGSEAVSQALGALIRQVAGATRN